MAGSNQDPKVESYSVTDDEPGVSASVTRDACAALGKMEMEGDEEPWPSPAAMYRERFLKALSNVQTRTLASGFNDGGGARPRGMKTTTRWLDLYFDTAARHARMSKDTTQVGACLVGLDGEVRMAAFNGPPRGVLDLPERRERPEKYLFASHAEQNLVAFCAREGIPMKGCAVFVTHSPCSVCARSLIQAGVASVYVDHGTTNMPWAEFAAAEAMFKEAGVALVKRQGPA